MIFVATGGWLVRISLDLLLLVPRTVLAFNLAWNPFVLLTRKALEYTHQQLQTITTRYVRVNNVNNVNNRNRSSTCDRNTSDHMRWLQPGERNGERVAIASYPRCGNSLMRGLLEKVTGVYTGCDTRPDRVLSQELQAYGLKGEGVVDDSVWFVKTHFPERVGYKAFPVHKVILVVRNPWDALDSYFNMTLTNTHNQSVHESQYARFRERWDRLVRHEIDVWMKFYRYWTTTVDVPVIVVRYENLLLHREETLRRVFLFLTGKETLEGTTWEQRIRDVVATSGDHDGPYKPRSGKIGASFRHFSDEQFEFIRTTANLPLRGFGYDPVTQNFPTDIRLPKRQVKPGKAGATLLVSIDQDMEIRKKNDSFGRGSTHFRRALVEPVIASDGSELNMHEVLAARARLRAQKSEVDDRSDQKEKQQ
ncbi:unnamed protein product [Hyaloperonospora brassicae]|uniref:Sulfotransferase domain-containing protein n=1 Tax=Hyaloperonospora brassicae TaxID=162125 RepID=A0AAV0U8D0_HYABA|nr:unnamed protein product [Hyaloperonospora brassicae]